MQADGFHNSPFGQGGGDSDSERSLKLNDREGFYQSISTMTFILFLFKFFSIEFFSSVVHMFYEKVNVSLCIDKITLQGMAAHDIINSG